MKRNRVSTSVIILTGLWVYFLACLLVQVVKSIIEAISG